MNDNGIIPNWIAILFISLLLIILASSVQTQSIKDKEARQIICIGKVADSDGQPIPKAKVALYYNHSKWGLVNRIVEETESAADGSFVFEKPLTYSLATGYPYHRDSFVILVTHPDYALGWHKIARNRNRRDMNLS